MKFLIGVLYTIENEYEQCIQSIKKQINVEVEIFRIEGKSKKEAHDILYSTFMERSKDVDYFVKVDADMIIEKPNLFEEIADVFNREKELKHLKIPVFDFFTDQHIIGMHFYRSDVVWERKSEEIVFTDDHPVNVTDKNRLQLDSFTYRVTHCADSSPFQAFHYGLHRGIKVIQSLFVRENNKRESQGAFHFDNVHKLLWNYIKTIDENVLWAISGTSLAITGRFKKEHISYSNPFAKRVFYNVVQKKKRIILFFKGFISLISLYLKKPILLKVYFKNKIVNTYLRFKKLTR